MPQLVTSVGYTDNDEKLIKDFHACGSEMLAKAGAKVAHCPVSNMKLATGQTMPYAALKEAGVANDLAEDVVQRIADGIDSVTQ